MYQIARTVYEDAPHLQPEDVLTLAEAAKLLGVSVQAVAQALDRGALTTVIDPDAPSRQGRRLVLRAEVEAMAAKGRMEAGEQAAAG